MLKRILSMLLALALTCGLGIGALPHEAHAHDLAHTDAAGSEVYSSSSTGGCIAAGRQHEYVGTVTIQPTRTRAGEVTFTCSVCGDKFTRVLPAMGTDEDRGCLVYTMEGAGPVDAYGHSYGRIIEGTYFAKQTSDTTWEESIRSYPCQDTGLYHSVVWHAASPTCTLSDYSYYRCTICGEMELQEFKPALGHSYISRVTVQPTKDAPGVRTYYCTSCRATYTEEIPRLSGGYLVNVPASNGIAPFDSYGRGTGRVEGGTYFAEQTGADTYNSKMAGYTCPVTKRPHVVRLHKAAPDCSMGDYDYYYCENCEEKELLGATEALGHAYVGEIKVAPTATAEGLIEYTCSRCYDEQTRTLPATKTPAERGCKIYVMDGIGPYDKFGNSYGRIIGGAYSAEQIGEDQWKERIWDYICPETNAKHSVIWHEAEATCTQSDYSYYYCEDCGEMELQGLEEATGHTYTSKVTVQPTESTPGVLTYTCEVCGYTYTETIQPAKGGCLVNVPESEGPFDDFGRAYTRVDGGTYFAKEYRKGQYDSLIETYPCSANNGGSHEIVNHVATPTCVFSDYDYKTCTRCHETELLGLHEALGHDYIGEIKVKPTETSPGNVALACSRCHESTVKTLPALGTPESRGCKVYAPEGYGPFDDYNRSYGRIIGGTYYAQQTSDTRFEIKIRNYTCPSTGKTHRLEYHEAEPTCELADYNYYTCVSCGETELLAKAEATGHKYTVSVTKEPTETTAGERTYTCTVCGKSYTEEMPPVANGCLVEVPVGEGPFDDYGRSIGRVSGGTYFAKQTGEDTFEKLIGTYVCSANDGKTHVLATHTAAPSCTLSDYDYQYCTLCGERELYALHEALGHSNEAVLTTAPTETVPGVITFTCTRCGTKTTQQISATKTAAERGCLVYVPEGYGDKDTLGHSYSRVVRGTYFAETNDKGVLVPKIDTYTCPVSGGKHNLIQHKAEPTCTLSDYNYATCTHCGETELYALAPALGHTGTSVILTPATAGKEGLLQFTCTRCNQKGTETIPALDLPTEDTAHRDSSATPLFTRNVSAQDYESQGQVPTSYLYQRVDGNLCRVEVNGGTLQVEVYTPDYQLLNTSKVEMELTTFCGFYAGQSYNFVVYGQENQTETDTTEVYRVVKYAKDWTRLGAVSLMGEFTAVPGGVRMAEYNGYLYLRGSHTAYTGANALRTTGNVTFVIQQSTMTAVDKFTGITNSQAGSFEDSMAQYLGIDSTGYLVTADQAAGSYRGILLNRFQTQAGGNKLYPEDVTKTVNTVNMLSLVGQAGNRYTGASLGGLGLSNTSYFAVVSVDSRTAENATTEARNIMVLSLNSEDATKAGATAKSVYITNYTTTSLQSASTPQLVKFSDDLYLVLWEIKNAGGDGTRRYGVGTGSGTIGYVFLDGHGATKGTVQTAAGYLSDCQPIVVNGKAVWYVTGAGSNEKGDPIFYTLDQNGTLAAAPWRHAAPYFTDVPEREWYFPHVQQAHEEGAVNGTASPTGDGMVYLPDNTIQMADFSGMLVNAFYEDEDTAGSVKPWYANKIAVMERHKLFDGMDSLEPTSVINRYNMAVILYNILVDHNVTMPTNEQLLAAQAGIRDWNDVPERFQRAVSVCFALGILTGTEYGDFAGTISMTRAQMAATYCTLSNALKTPVPATPAA